jgi:hypothetical protein
MAGRLYFFLHTGRGLFFIEQRIKIIAVSIPETP